MDIYNIFIINFLGGCVQPVSFSSSFSSRLISAVAAGIEAVRQRTVCILSFPQRASVRNAHTNHANILTPPGTAPA